MVTLEKPLGIRFASSFDGKIFVHALKKGGNAEKSRIIMVGDSVKSASIGHDRGFVAIKDFADTQKLLEGAEGQLSLVLERPYSPFPIQQFSAMSDIDILFNRGRVPIVTWNRNVLASNLQTSLESSGNSGQLVSIFSDEGSEDAEWAHGSFCLEEYIKALDRAKGELIYNHSRGMQYNKITEQIYVGSCIQTEADVEALANVLDTSLNGACNFVTALHQCRPNRPAIVWATLDLIAMMEKGKHDGPPTHAVSLCGGEDVYLVRAIHKGGSRFEADIKLSHGRYCYEYIINGNWRYSTSSRTVIDEHGNVNNVIVVGDVASDSAVVKVIERISTEVERVMLAKAARCVTFSICPIRGVERFGSG
ncbi:hypothetical protein OROHE_009471 [Orobanche hederae]